ncbi:hypothetical protein AB0L40_03590 [Patulibacter sp. NPDC049589]|uniref:hypothetical protein n=1 Tax=Patulibacter sp. NPDC049589 TaxID=3154731 RepID=UPI0034246841
MERPVVTRRTKIATGAAAVVVVVLILAVAVLPGVARSAAKDKVRDRVGDDSAKVSVKGSWPKLLTGKADEVVVDTPTVAGSQEAPLGELLKDSKKVGKTDARIGRIQVQGLTLRDVHAIVQDGRVQATAKLSIKSLTKLVPLGGTLKSLPAGAEGQPRFQVTVDVPLLGSTTVSAAVAAVDGAVQVAAENLPIPVAITVFSDPSISVTSVEGRAKGDELSIAFTGAVN